MSAGPGGRRLRHIPAASALVGLALCIVERAAGAQFCDAINYGTVGGGIVLTTWIAVLALLRIRTAGR